MEVFGVESNSAACAVIGTELAILSVVITLSVTVCVAGTTVIILAVLVVEVFRQRFVAEVVVA